MPETEGEALELRGRMMLWQAALRECQRFVALLQRSETELWGAAKDRHNNWLFELAEYSKRLPDFDPEKPNHRHRSQYEKSHPQPFPSIADCHTASHASRVSAVVFFCQIINQGWRDEGVVAGNLDRPIRNHWEQVLEEAFPDPHERKQFDNLTEQCRTLRNQMIGHAKGEAFNVIQGSNFITHAGAHNKLLDIDFEFMGTAVNRLEHAIEDNIQHHCDEVLKALPLHPGTTFSFSYSYVLGPSTDTDSEPM